MYVETFLSVMMFVDINLTLILLTGEAGQRHITRGEGGREVGGREGSQEEGE